MKQDTLGKITLDLVHKAEHEKPISVMELGSEMLQEVEQQFIEEYKRAKQSFDDDFFLAILYRTNRLIPQAIQYYVLSLSSCPTPNYDQSVFKYHKKEDRLELIWTIPHREACFMLLENAVQVAPEEKELLRYVLDFKDGTLHAKMRSLNNEPEMIPTIILTRE